MIFNSFEFFLFFPAVTALYFVVPHPARWALLLTASCYFYMAFIPVYILILAVTIGVDYAAGLLIERSSGVTRRAFLILSLVSNIGFLSFFKYADFLGSNLNGLSSFLHWNYSIPLLAIALPVGLSFHTFQAMSYTVEVYRGRVKAERHPGIFALYVMFYPQLVAGPIERPQHLLPQFRAKHTFDTGRLLSGLRQIFWGLFKKMVIADRLSPLVGQVFGFPQDYTGLPLILATYAFAVQIYCDFSGYSDVAIGAARAMGFELSPNFDRPYAAASVREFWQRWHISLSSWFRDYLYVPLGGNRVRPFRLHTNILVVFLLSGLWHGASWTYAVWGLLHGSYLIVSRWLGALAGLLPRRAPGAEAGALAAAGRFLRILLVFHLVAFGWIFFRSATVRDAFYAASHLGTGLRAQLSGIAGWRWIGNTYGNFYLGLGLYDFAVAVIAAAAVYALERPRPATAPSAAADACASYGLLTALFLFAADHSSRFIYFQF